MSLAIQELASRIRQLSREELLSLTPDDAAQLDWTLEDARCAEAVASFDAGPLFWLTTLTKTENPQYQEMKAPFLAPFPKKSYFVPLFDAFLSRPKQLYIAKSRSMMTSWSAAGYAAWAAQWRQEETLIQTLSQEKAEHIIDYVWQLWSNQEDWLKERHPIERRSLLTVAWKGGGEVAGVAAGADKVRSYHSSTYILDEAAHVVEGEQCINAVLPSGANIICISTAKAGWFGDAVSR
ncbi:MAG TPA: hypothetical protein VK466_03145 [Terriglobales bacterium]|nr:hypothetical protein [Terriglobales bacterium]